MSGARSFLWPNQQQELLLQAVVGPDDAVRENFAAWKAMTDLDATIDLGTLGLLPMLYDRLHRLGVSDPLMARLKGIYRRCWYETHTLLHAMRPAVEALEQRGIPTLLLKGVPLTLTWYRTVGLRRMGDMDLAVPPEHARRAIDVLTRIGWIQYEGMTDEALHYRHSLLFRRPDGQELDLHWHIMFEACAPDADAAFWARSLPLDMRGVATRQLGATDMLLHTIIHGLRANPWPPIRWITDARAILDRDSASIDWDTLLAFARAIRLTHRLSLGLHALAERYGATIPRPVLDAARGQRTSILERIENSVVLGDSTRLYDGALTKQWVIFAEYCRIAHTRDPLSFINGFPHYIRFRWNLRGRREILPVVLRGMARRLVPAAR